MGMYKCIRIMEVARGLLDNDGVQVLQSCDMSESQKLFVGRICNELVISYSYLSHGKTLKAMWRS